jgi:hypothetical protein
VSGGAAGASDPVARFAIAADQYCVWAEHTPASTDGEIETSVRLLLDLMTRALVLPAADSDHEESRGSTEEERKVVLRRFETLGLPWYATCDPSDVGAENLLTGDVCDDPTDIWSEVREGLDVCRTGRIDRASWHWALTFRGHCSAHAAEALRVLMSKLHAA